MATLQSTGWLTPRRVDSGRQLWRHIRLYSGASEVTGELIVEREGTVAWAADGTGHYGVFLSIGRYGLHCWPDFRALADAQEFVERLMAMPLDDVRREHGRQWPGVVL